MKRGSAEVILLRRFRQRRLDRSRNLTLRRLILEINSAMISFGMRLTQRQLTLLTGQTSLGEAPTGSLTGFVGSIGQETHGTSLMVG